MAYKQPEEFIFLSTQTASSSASLSFTSLITSQYPVYYIKIRNLVPASNATNLLLTFSTDNGSSYLSANYLWCDYRYTSVAASSTRSASDSSIEVANLVSSTSTSPLNMNMYLYGFGQSVSATITAFGGLENSSTNSQGIVAGGTNSSTTAVNAIKFAMSSGNIASGTITLYGMTL